MISKLDKLLVDESLNEICFSGWAFYDRRGRKYSMIEVLSMGKLVQENEAVVYDHSVQYN
jgi:hypothetical protein